MLTDNSMLTGELISTSFLGLLGYFWFCRNLTRPCVSPSSQSVASPRSISGILSPICLILFSLNVRAEGFKLALLSQRFPYYSGEKNQPQRLRSTLFIQILYFSITTM